MKPPGRHRLALSIAAALAVKVLILYGLWSAFFSHPQTRKMRLPTQQVESHLLAAPAHPQPAKVNDGSR